MKRFAITTLGCKVNQCESAAIGHLLEAAGFLRQTPQAPVDVLIVNTCTVTGKAAMQSRQAIRQARRANPEARIVVTGCYAQTAPEEIRAIEGVDLIVGHTHKMRLAELVASLPCPDQEKKTCPSIVDSAFSAGCFAALPSAAREGRTRAFLKVQDGCNTLCTYCIVPYARGRSRSMPVRDVVGHLESLRVEGFREVVLTGIHLGAYGLDLSPPATLVALLRQIEDLPLVDRLRLSSIEPTEIESTLLDLIASSGGRLCPHLHVPLQSGDDQVLKRMGRPYDRDRYAHVIRAIRDRLPEAAIGADVLVGFPGEDGAAFRQTVDLIQALPLTYLHVFPFSARKGTPAAGFKEKVPESMIKQRCRELRVLAEEKKNQFVRSQIGKTVQVLIETVDPATGDSQGLTQNYISVVLKASRLSSNTLVHSRIESVETDGTVLASIEPY